MSAPALAGTVPGRLLRARRMNESQFIVYILILDRFVKLFLTFLKKEASYVQIQIKYYCVIDSYYRSIFRYQHHGRGACDQKGVFGRGIQRIVKKGARYLFFGRSRGF